MLDRTAEEATLPKHMEDRVLQQIKIQLLTVNNNEYLAVRNFLQPLDEHQKIYKFMQKLTYGQAQIDHAIYVIGKYGSCITTIRRIPSVWK